MNIKVALIIIIFLQGCASNEKKYNESTLCPEGSSKEHAGETFIVSSTFNGFLSLWKDRFPWESSHLGPYSKETPNLELVCVEPKVNSLGMKQRQVVYKIKNKSNSEYVFGVADYGTHPAGVVSEKEFLEVKKLVGKPIWVAGSAAGTLHEKINNLSAYTVSRVEISKRVIENYDFYMILSDKNKEIRVPLVFDQKHQITIPAKRLFQSEQTAETLGITNKEIEFVRKNLIFVGMSDVAVFLSIGYPEKINRTTTSSGATEQLVYELGKYVYISNGRVTAIQD